LTGLPCFFVAAAGADVGGDGPVLGDDRSGLVGADRVAVDRAELHHVALVVGDADEAHAFYRDVIGLTPIPRPEEGTPEPGSWLQLSDGRQLHLFAPADPSVNRPHFGIAVDDLAAKVADIRSHGVTVYEVEHVQGLGHQAFVIDLSGNIIELNEPD
jgi:catechol 2,3-dioxygenase-like lactoylglutathione lyase family enzyme